MEDKDVFCVSENDNAIDQLIYFVRGEQVMLDSDLAVLYGTEAKRINEAVRRNSNRFPERFCFRISEQEYRILKSQFATSKGGSKKGHTVFTEQGVAMLAACLRTPTAVEASIKIMDAYVALRKYFTNGVISNKILEHDERIKLLELSFDEFNKKKKENEVYFDGQIFDAYSKILDIFRMATEKIIVVDNYADKILLDIIKTLKVKVIIVTKKNGPLTDLDVSKYNMQYSNLNLVRNDRFHDRYFIIDDKIVFHCGASINRIGYKTFSISQIKDDNICNAIINSVKIQ